MDLAERIRRRREGGGDPPLVRDYDAISPVSHVPEPTGRGRILERLLDALDPVFDGDLPPETYVWGPAGAGKSALVTALFDRLSAQVAGSEAVIHTATRAEAGGDLAFVYVDARTADSPFALYRAVLDALVDERVPARGVGTDRLRDRLARELADGPGIVVAVDHVGESGTPDLATVADHLSPLSRLSWLAVGRTDPDAVAASPAERVAIPAYRRHALADVLTSRASAGLAERAIEHEGVREVADWADGDAHDALAALFAAADHAAVAGRSRIADADREAGFADVPRPSCALGRVFALPANRQRVCRVLVELDDDERGSVAAATDAVAARVDLSPGTVERFLYELAETGVVERVRSDAAGDHGRPPSRVEPRFPTAVFRRLYDRRGEN
ncbi:MAG: Cdc6/Cdc18 family protein [Halorientalis sp.]